jgi:hypothetical protein
MSLRFTYLLGHARFSSPRKKPRGFLLPINFHHIDFTKGVCGRYRFIILLVPIAALCVTPVFPADAQTTNMEILIDKVKADKKLLIASNMNLTDQEAKEFWPIYESYQKDLGRLNSHLGTLIGEYAEAYNTGPVPKEVAKI